MVNGRQDNWAECLAEVESSHNNLPNASTSKSPNKILFGFNTRHALEAGLVNDCPVSDNLDSFICNRDAIRREAIDALAFASARMKANHDKSHRLTEFNVGDLVHIKFSGSMQPGYQPKNVPC